MKTYKFIQTNLCFFANCKNSKEAAKNETRLSI